MTQTIPYLLAILINFLLSKPNNYIAPLPLNKYLKLTKGLASTGFNPTRLVHNQTLSVGISQGVDPIKNINYI